MTISGFNADTAIAAVLQREGGYVDHPADRGGPTNFGITEQVARAYGYSGAMRDLPRELALRIYRSIYWERPGFGQVAARMPRLAAELFDTGVNMGPRVAGKFLQRALNLLNRRGSDYPDIAADGDIGPVTIHALERLAARRANAEQLLIRCCDGFQLARYADIAEADPSQEVFMPGWIGERVGMA